MGSALAPLHRAQPDRVVQAIAHSAQRTNVDFAYLMGQARLESGLDPDARAATSSATGLFQFIKQSWLGVVHQHGAKHGLGWAAAAITRDAAGRLGVADPVLRHEILELRRNPELAALLAGEFAADNRAYLEQRLGRAAPPVDLYLAHFLGPGGAVKFLSSHAADPEASAAPLFPQAAAANRAVFYDSHGRARSLDAIRERFAAKLANSATRPAGPSELPANAPAVPFVQPADYLRLARQQNMPVAGSASTNPNAQLAYLLLASLQG